MSAKPSSAFSWATAGARVAASLAKVAAGFVPRERPPAQILNDILAQIGDWTGYLSDGAFSGNHSIAGNLTVTGTAQVNGAAQTGGVLTAGGLALSFTTHTFTASSGTDLLTVVAHGLQTGDGPVRVSNSGGALPSPLLAATDYWVIRVSADTFFLALSLVDALAGTTINLTTNGTGTNSIVGTGSTIRVAATHATGDLTVDGGAIVAGVAQAAYQRRTTTLRRKVHTTGGWGGNGAAAVFPMTGFVDLPGATAQWYVPIEFDEKERILGFDVFVRGDTVATVTADLMYNDASTAAPVSVVSSTSVANGLGQTVTGFITHDVPLALRGYFLKFTVTGAVSVQLQVGVAQVSTTIAV